jgi:hypothetical protein
MLLTVKEKRAVLIRCFERLNMKYTEIEGSEELEEHALFIGQFKGKCRNYGRIGHKSFQCKNRSNHNGGNKGNITRENYCFHCRKPGHVRHNYFKLKKKETRYGHNQAGNNKNGNRDRKTMTHKMWYLQLPPKMRGSQKISGFVILELVA